MSGSIHIGLLVNLTILVVTKTALNFHLQGLGMTAIAPPPMGTSVKKTYNSKPARLHAYITGVLTGQVRME
jgi:hypothetical protein